MDTTTVDPAGAVRILRLPQVQAQVGLSRSTIYLQVQEGTFPAPIKLGARAVGWLESDVHNWLTNRISAARANRVSPTSPAAELSQ